MSAWQSLRPLFNRLPFVYRDVETPVNPSDVITDYWDELLVGLKSDIQNFYSRFLNPDSAPSEWLDWIAQLCGFSEDYWSPVWSEAIKRQLIKDSFTRVWLERGTKTGVDYWFDLFEIPSFNPGNSSETTWVQTFFRVGETTLPGTLGVNDFNWFIRLEDSIVRGGETWRLSERIKNLHTPVWTQAILGYKYFYLGRSALGEGVFDWLWEQAFPYKLQYESLIPEGENSTIALLQYLLENLGYAGEVSEYPVFQLGVSGFGTPLYRKHYIFVEHPYPETSLHGSNELIHTNQIADRFLTPDSNRKVIPCFDAFYVGASLCNQPLFPPGDYSERRTVTLTDSGESLSASYVDPDFDYPSKSVFTHLNDWVNAGYSRVLDALATLQFLLDRELPGNNSVHACEIVGEFRVGVSPLPAPVAAPPKLLALFEDNADWRSTPDWGKVENIFEWVLNYLDHAVGYEHFELGDSGLGEPVFPNSIEPFRYQRTVTLSPTTLERTYTDPYNPDPYPNRDVFDALSEWNGDVNEVGTTLGFAQWCLDRLLPDPSVISLREMPFFRVGSTPSENWIGEAPTLYAIVDGSAVTQGDGTWNEIDRILGLLCGRTGYFLCYESFELEATPLPHPIFDTTSPHTLRSATSNLTIGTTTYSEPDIDYEDKDAYVAAYNYLEPLEFESPSSIDEFSDYLEFVLSALGYSEVSVFSSNSSEYIILEIPYNGTIVCESTIWVRSKRISTKLNPHPVVIGHENLYLGFSPLPASL